MHELLLSQAALAASPKICGRYLRPFSLGHLLYLIRENSPFVFVGTPLPQDVFEAVWICSSTWDLLAKAQDSVTYLPQLWFLKRAVKKSDHETNVKALEDYFENGKLLFPPSDTVRPETQSSGRELGSPFVLRLQQFLMMQLGKSESEAWDYPFGLATMRWQTYWEQKGCFDVYNEYDAACDPELAEAEIEARKAKGNQ